MAYRIMQPRFPLGRTVATPGAIELGIDLASYMHRHHCGDWGDLCDEDKQSNEDALIHGDRILSHYKAAGASTSSRRLIGRALASCDPRSIELKAIRCRRAKC